jgi:hypothetical protein
MGVTDSMYKQASVTVPGVRTSRQLPAGLCSTLLDLRSAQQCDWL